VQSVRELLVGNRDFRRLFLASVVSLAGDWFSFVAVADLVARLTGRPGAAAFVYAATVLPIFLASPIAGAVGDRFDRKRILIIADLIRVPITLLLCVAAWVGSVELAILAVVGIGVGASFHDPIASAATPNLVDKDDLSLAQALMGAVWGSMLLIGAGLGGVVAEVFGIQAAFVIDALSFLVSAWLVAGIDKPMQLASAEERRRQQPFSAIVRYIRGDRVVSRLVLAKVGVSVANGTVGLLPAFAHGKFAGTNIATGLLFAARGLGALVGPMVARWILGPTPRPRAIAVLCGGATLLYCAFYAVLPLTPVFAVAMVLVMIAHMGGGAQWAMSSYGLQVAAPDHVRGRVMAIDYGLATLAIGASSIAAGVLADVLDEDRATWWLAAAGAIYTLCWLAWSLPGMRGMHATRAAASPAPDRLDERQPPA
jgi:MFS family permease